MKQYFKLEEFLKSDTALYYKIQNIPSFEIIDHIKEMLPLLNELREQWGSGIKITSGYRSEELNAAVGGSNKSAHLIGYAVDLIPSNGKILEFIGFCEEFFKDKNFDQLILETKRTATERVRWVHLGLYNHKGEQRKQIFKMSKE